MFESIYIAVSLLLFLIIVSSFLSVAEVVYSAERGRLLNSIPSNDPVYNLLIKPERFFSVVLIFDNIANVAITALITSQVVKRIGEWAVPISSVIVALIIITFGEILPKVWGIKNSDVLAKLILGPVNIIARMVSPLISPFEKLLRKVRIEELKANLTYFEKEQIKMVEGINALRELELKDIMIPRHQVICIDANLSISDVIKVIEETKHTRYPVQLESKIIGILLSKSFLLATQGFPSEDLKNKRLRELIDSKGDILHPVRFAPPTKSALQQLIDFKKWKTHMVCIIDATGEFEGIVTLEDILEEITGKIHDEHSRETLLFWKEGEYVYVRGEAPIRDVARELGITINDDFHTFSSTIISVLGRLPHKGEKVLYDGIEFEIVDVTGNKINAVRFKLGKKGVATNITLP